MADTLNAILSANGYCWSQQKDIVIISKVSDEKRSSPSVQGREISVFDLNYVAATDVDKVVQGLLSRLANRS